MRKILWLSLMLVSLVLVPGCSETKEPEGTIVILSQEEINAKSWANEESRMSIAWFDKANELRNSSRYNEALYCYHQSINFWPEKIEKENPRIRHMPEPTSSYLKLAELYIEMGEPELALKYYEKFTKYFPHDPLAREGIERGKEMMK